MVNSGVIKPAASWPPEWFETFKSTFTCKAELSYSYSDFFYPTDEIREHAKAMALIMGLRTDASYYVIVEGQKFPYKLRIYHAK